MLLIAVDLGTYSLKFLHFRIDKKRIQLESSDEITIDFDDKTGPAEHKLWEIQLQTVQDYLAQISEDYQLTLNMKSEIVSTRFIQIPGKNKKKALMMLPFQIEEDLPYPLSECHYAESIFVEKDKCHITAGIIKKSHFEDFYFTLKSHNIAPKILTSDVSLYSQFVKANADSLPESFCILELGHEGTRGYFFKNGKLVSNHHSYIAGKVITENIAKNYNISLDEAAIYKHQNAFVLTENQIEQVDKNQKDFAKMMDTTLQSLLNEIRRWEIGYRVAHGEVSTDYLICGGTSNIKNMTTYLKYNLEAEVGLFDPFENTNDRYFDKEIKYRAKFAQVVTMAQAVRNKSQLLNFLKGKYSLQAGAELPIHNVAFLGARFMIVALIICSILFVDQMMTNQDYAIANKKMSSLLKNNTFKLSGREIRTVARINPEQILRKLNRQKNQVKQEIKVIQSSVKTNAIKSLTELSSYLTGQDIQVLEFSAVDGDNFKLTVKGKDLKTIEELEKAFSANNNFFVEKDAAKLTLSVGGEEKDL